MTIAITGATSGIGFETAKAILEKGHKVIFLIRNIEKAESLIENIPQKENITLIACDLADLASVKQASLKLMETKEQLDVLINNAGGTFNGRYESKDGFELHLAVNHFGHFLLVKNCFDYLKKCNTKIVNVSSEAHRAGHLDFSDLNQEKKYSGIKAYGNAKLCNILFTKSLADKGLTSYALHPGVIDSGFGDNLNTIFENTVDIRQTIYEKPAGRRFHLYLPCAQYA